MPLLDVLFGRPLASGEARAEKIGPAAGIPIFGLDALSSAAYGPEAALTLLIPLGAAGIAYIIPVSARHHRAAVDRVFLVPADDCSLSRRRRSYTVAR
jgi:hypothetical protein